MKFDAHGEYTLLIKDGILYTDATGPFNEETAHQYTLEYQALIITAQPKLQLTTLHGTSIFSPDIEASLVQLHKWSAQRGLRAEALILDVEKNEHGILMAQAKSIFEEINTSYRFFETKEEALAWLNSFI